MEASRKLVWTTHDRDEVAEKKCCTWCPLSVEMPILLQSSGSRIEACVLPSLQVSLGLASLAFPRCLVVVAFSMGWGRWGKSWRRRPSTCATSSDGRLAGKDEERSSRYGHIWKVEAKEVQKHLYTIVETKCGVRVIITWTSASQRQF